MNRVSALGGGGTLQSEELFLLEAVPFQKPFYVNGGRSGVTRPRYTKAANFLSLESQYLNICKKTECKWCRNILYEKRASTQWLEGQGSSVRYVHVASD